MVSSSRSSIEQALGGEPSVIGSTRVTTKLSPVQLSVIRKAVAEALDRPSPTLGSGRLIGSKPKSFALRTEVILPTDYAFRLASPMVVSSALNKQQHICRKAGDVLTLKKGTRVRMGDGSIEVVSSPQKKGSQHGEYIQIYGDQLYLSPSCKPIRFDQCPGLVKSGTIFAIALKEQESNSQSITALARVVSGDLLA